jgi:3-methyladenine DNA glycosylase AlkD
MARRETRRTHHSCRRTRTRDGTRALALHRAYLANTAYVNNWDLVDSSAAELVGSHIGTRGTRMLDTERAFLDRHAATMPRVALRYAIEKFAETERRKYMTMR